jgi:hypothetical protein
MGYASNQPYSAGSATYDCYILNIVGYTGTPTLVAITSASGVVGSGPVYVIQTNDNNSYYYNNKISMSLYIYPQALL